MGHISHNVIHNAVTSSLIVGVNLDPKSEPTFCETCVKAKIPHLPFSKASSTHATVYGERVWSDVWGLAPVESISHKLYMLTFSDESSCETVLYFIAKKSEVFMNYKNYEAWVKKHRNKDGIKNICSDHARDYLSLECITYLKSQGTHHELTIHNSPPQNGMANVTNCVIVYLGRSFLISSGLPRFLWPEAFHHATWIKFRSPHAALPNTTPYEFVHKEKPNFKDLHKFGATVYVKDLTVEKLDVQAKIGKFIRYDNKSKGYQIYWPKKRSVTIKREVRFDPDEILIPEDKLSNKGEWPTFGDYSVTNKIPTTPTPPVVEPPAIANHEAPHISAPRPCNIPVKTIPQPRLPDGLTPPEPNTSRGYHIRPTEVSSWRTPMLCLNSQIMMTTHYSVLQ
jgi:hypothetical protein